jgi:hypothetical protein
MPPVFRYYGGTIYAYSPHREGPKVKRTLFFCLVLGVSLFLYPQQEPLQHVTGVTNVEVPVRVFDGDKFIDTLTLNDFEVSENGIPQKVAAVYLVKRTDVLRKEAATPLEPNTHRTFYRFFELHEYIPRLKEALSYFIKNVLSPQDDLVIVTSMKTYNLKKDTLGHMSKEQVIDQLNGLVRTDTLEGNAEYRHVLDDLRGAARIISATLGVRGAGQTSRMDSGNWGAVGDLDEVLEQYRLSAQNREHEVG